MVQLTVFDIPKTMGKAKKYSIDFIDVLVVLLNIAAGRGNILLYWLLGVTEGVWGMLFVIMVDTIYLVLRHDHINVNTLKHITPVYFFLFILFYHFFLFLVDLPGSPVSSLIRLIIALLFSLILISITNRAKFNMNDLRSNVSKFSRGYIILSLISLGGVILSFLLLSGGMQSFHPISADFLEANIDRGTSTYYRSFFSVNLVCLDIRVPFFQDYGILCGLFHEPHIFAYNIFPCMFLLLGLATSRIRVFLIVIAILLTTLFSGSTTSILALAICLVVFGVLRFRHNALGVLVCLALLFGLIIWYYSYDDTLFQVMSARLDTEGTSQGYSEDLLRFAFTPKTLFGSDFLTTSFVFDTYSKLDVGYIAFFLNIGFILFYVRNIILLFKRKDNLSVTFGLASLYFLLHSVKIGLAIYLQTLPLFFVFLQALILNNNGRIRISEKSLPN